MDFEQVYQTYFKSVYRYIRRPFGRQNSCRGDHERDLCAGHALDRKFPRGLRPAGLDLPDRQKHLLHPSQKAEPGRRAGRRSLARAGRSGRPGGGAPGRKRGRAAHPRAAAHAAEPYKEVFMWRTLGELSFAEIGALYGKTANWACVDLPPGPPADQNRNGGTPMKQECSIVQDLLPLYVENMVNADTAAFIRATSKPAPAVRRPSPRCRGTKRPRRPKPADAKTTRR